MNFASSDFFDKFELIIIKQHLVTVVAVPRFELAGLHRKLAKSFGAGGKVYRKWRVERRL